MAYSSYEELKKVTGIDYSDFNRIEREHADAYIAEHPLTEWFEQNLPKTLYESITLMVFHESQDDKAIRYFSPGDISEVQSDINIEENDGKITPEAASELRLKYLGYPTTC